MIKGKRKTTRQKRISINKKMTAPSSYVIDARKLIQPWITIEGEGPTPPPPITPRPPRSITLTLLDEKVEEPTQKESPIDNIFLLLYLLWHPVVWYKHIQLTKQENKKTRKQEEKPVAAGFSLRRRALKGAATLFTKFYPQNLQLPQPKIPSIKWQKRISITSSTKKAVISFALMAGFLMMPFQSLTSLSIFSTKTTLEQQLAKIQTQLQQDAPPATLAPSLFELINTFKQAEKQMGVGHDVLKLAAFAPIPLGKLQSNAALFEAGLAVSNAVTTLHDTLASLPENATTAEKANELLQTVQAIEPDLEQIKKSLTHIHENDVPEEARQHLPYIKQMVVAAHRDVQTINHTTKALLTLLGPEHPTRFLVLFQNDAELRATGGFIGGFGLLDIKDGAIKKFYVPPSGSYAVQGQLTAFLRAPEPMHTINTRWEFQDSNWFPDFPTSAETAMRLYELSHGATVDGVIAINTSVLEGFLEILGPVDNPLDTTTTITAQNAIQQIQKNIQQYKKDGKSPKEIITVLAPILIDGLSELTPAQALNFIQLFNTARNQKDILVYAKDKNTQHNLQELAWDGSIDQSTPHDYLQVVHTNIGGSKTDAMMQQRILQHTEIQPDGAVHKRVTIARTHTGSPQDNHTNRDYLRIYVPKGSKLISAAGFDQPPESTFHAPETWYDEHPVLAAIEKTERYDQKTGVKIYEAFGKTVFANWMLTKPGETGIIEIEYQLPEKLFDVSNLKTGLLRKQPSFTYSIKAIKQPGARNTELLTSIELPKNWEPVWLADNQMELGPGVVIHRTILDTDKLIGLVAAHE